MIMPLKGNVKKCQSIIIKDVIRELGFAFFYKLYAIIYLKPEYIANQPNSDKNHFYDYHGFAGMFWDSITVLPHPGKPNKCRQFLGTIL